MNIVLVAPYRQLVGHAEEVCRVYGEKVKIVLGSMDDAVQLGEKAIEQGAGVLISRGGTYLHLSDQLSVPTVEIAVTPYDVLRALQKAQGLGTKFGIAGFDNVIGSMKEWGSMLSAPVVPIEIVDISHIRRQLKHATEKQGVNCILGDTTVIEQAVQLGVPSVLIESGKEAIWDAIQEAKRIVFARMAERRVHQSLHSALDRASQGLLVLEHGVVKFANRMVQQLIGRDTYAGVDAEVWLPESLHTFISDSDLTKKTDMIQLGGKLWFIERSPVFDESWTCVTMHQVDEIESIERQVRQKRSQAGHVARYTFDDLYGQSRAIRSVVVRAIHFARSDSSVLIVGETGTGKEVLAQSIHNASARAKGPFVAVNCSALPDQLLESELFGYDDGAYTGARKGGKPGLFELAHGGTIFLDEIGGTALHVQQSLLRVLQERTVMRIGGEKVIPVDVRVIAATNQPLWQFVAENKFRKDLFFRLDVLRLNTVPLRERLEDIPELTERFFYRLWYQRKGLGVRPRIDPGVYPMLQKYYWPGNVRELQNMVDYLFATVSQGRITLESITEWFTHKALPPEPDTSGQATKPQSGLIGRTLEDMEKWMIDETLKKTAGDMTKAARTLGISRTTLWRKLKQWDIDSDEAGTNFANSTMQAVNDRCPERGS